MKTKNTPWETLAYSRDPSLLLRNSLHYANLKGMIHQLKGYFEGLAATLQEGRFLPFLRKVGAVLLTISVLPLLALVYLLRPFLLIRFAPLCSGTMGHFAAYPEVYLCEKEAGLLGPKRAIDLFYNQRLVCNEQLKKMWSRVLTVWSVARYLDRANQWFPWYRSHSVPMPFDLDESALLRNTPPHLTFTSKEEMFGAQELRKLGITGDFVCLFVRDGAYSLTIDPNKDWNYHNYRNSDVRKCVPAVLELAGRGLGVVRMGAVVKEPLHVDHSKFFDYSTKARSDFLDVYLTAKCRFFLGSTAGLSQISRIFRRPIAFINFIPLGLQHIYFIAANGLFIPKKLRWRDKNRLMTFREIIENRAGDFYRSEQYDALGVEVIENSPEEITALVLEMEGRLSGTWKAVPEDEVLQRKFWTIYESYGRRYKNGVRIGAEFLRDNRELLE